MAGDWASLIAEEVGAFRFREMKDTFPKNEMRCG